MIGSLPAGLPHLEQQKVTIIAIVATAIAIVATIIAGIIATAIAIIIAVISTMTSLP